MPQHQRFFSMLFQAVSIGVSKTMRFAILRKVPPFLGVSLV